MKSRQPNGHGRPPPNYLAINILFNETFTAAQMNLAYFSQNLRHGQIKEEVIKLCFTFSTTSVMNLSVISFLFAIKCRVQFKQKTTFGEGGPINRGIIAIFLATTVVQLFNYNTAPNPTKMVWQLIKSNAIGYNIIRDLYTFVMITMHIFTELARNNVKMSRFFT